MSNNSQAAQTPTAAAGSNEVKSVVTSITHTATFNFRNWKKDQAGYTKLAEAIASGALANEDIKVTKAKLDNGEPGNEADDLYQRVPAVLVLSVPLVSSFLVEGALNPAQADHLQCLINAAVEKAHSVLVEAGNVASSAYKSWETVLAAPYKQRTAAVKVTDEMVKATNVLFEAYLVQVGSAERGVLLMTKLAAKKFAIAACARTQLNIMEAIQGRLVGFIEGMEDVLQHEHAAVLNLWAGNLEKIINPELEEDIDEDMI